MIHDAHQLLGSRKGQGPKQNRVYQAEDGGIGSDAEREREDDHGGEAGILA